MGNGLVETLERDSTHIPVDVGSVVDSVHVKHPRGLSRGIATLANFVVVPFGYGFVPDSVIDDTKRMVVNAKGHLKHYGDSFVSFFDDLMNGHDRRAERRAASRQIGRIGYILRGVDIFYPTEIKVNGEVVERREEHVGRLMVDGNYNRATIHWDHHHRLDIPLRDAGYLSVSPVDKV